jgi:hypothetical protein
MSEKLRVTISTGTLDRNGASVRSLPEKRDYLIRMLSEEFGGVTVKDAEGGWMGSMGLVIEPSVVYELFIDADKLGIAREWASVIKAFYNQEAVQFTAQRVEVLEYV